jgi:hypothetical protein
MPRSFWRIITAEPNSSTRCQNSLGTVSKGSSSSTQPGRRAVMMGEPAVVIVES